MPKGPQYILGAGLSISVAAGAGIFAVLSSKCKEVPSCFFMLTGGGVSMVVGVIHRVVMANPESDYSGRLIGLLVTVATMSMVGVLMKQMAVAATCPVLVTVVRSMEIVMFRYNKDRHVCRAKDPKCDYLTPLAGRPRDRHISNEM